ncbi:MAG: hypothetical protein NTW12_09295 [Deltaproteobacteria bacterium]|nr:hypothetical protein [Deltaproteobacteria bacterium]
MEEEEKGGNSAHDGHLLGMMHMMDQHMDDLAFPITRDITCLHCCHNGVMDIHDEKDVAADGRLFLPSLRT